MEVEGVEPSVCVEGKYSTAELHPQHVAEFRGTLGAGSFLRQRPAGQVRPRDWRTEATLDAFVASVQACAHFIHLQMQARDPVL